MKNIHVLPTEIDFANEIEQISEYDKGRWYGRIEGAKRKMKRMYSEEDVYDLLVEWTAYQNGFPRVDEDEIPNGFMSFNQWFEQFKKK